MPSLRVAVCLLVCACAAFAFQCYSGQTTSNSHPSSTTDCTGSYCTKIAVKTDSETTYNYGCDMTKVCAKEGCYSGVSGAQVCCCGSNLCNSSTKLSGLFALAPIALIKILAF
ncbi:ET module [Cooperia oncophora]